MPKKTKDWEGTILEHEFLHVRCCVHILNLIVCDGLKELDSSIACIREVVRYVRSSPNRLEAFKICAKKEKIESKYLHLDVPTRWNSTYLMFDAAISLRRFLIDFMMRTLVSTLFLRMMRLARERMNVMNMGTLE